MQPVLTATKSDDHTVAKRIEDGPRTSMVLKVARVVAGTTILHDLS